MAWGEYTHFNGILLCLNLFVSYQNQNYYNFTPSGLSYLV